MKDKNRNAIRQVLKPSMYYTMLISDTGCAICKTCTQDNVHELIRDLRTGFFTDLSTLCLAETDGRVMCEYCEQEFGEYDDSSDYYMDPNEAEAMEAAESLYANDNDLDGIY